MTTKRIITFVINVTIYASAFRSPNKFGTKKRLRTLTTMFVITINIITFTTKVVCPINVVGTGTPLRPCIHG